MLPSWFTKAISAPCESRFVDVDGSRVHYLAWNITDRNKPGLLFAHGFRAHARWWSFIAPFFLSRYRVIALDFPGMGDSASRAQYEWLDFSRSIRAVAQHAEFDRATLVGHSFGGSHVARAAFEYPDLVERAVIIDSYIPVLGVQGRRPLMEVRPKNVYPTYEAARARFRLVPEENIAASYVLDHIALHSLKEVPGGWSWKFDETFVPRQLAPSVDELISVLTGIRCPTTIIYGERSTVVSRELAHAIVKHLKHGHGPIAVPDSHHHVLLDQPIALIAALKAALY